MITVPEQISNPVGIDILINELQTYLSTNVSWLTHVFGRVYNIDNKPCVYVSSKEYLEVFPDDSVIGMVFFDAASTETMNKQGNQVVDSSVELNMIFFVNLEKINNYTFRSDENVKEEIQNLFVLGNTFLGYYIELDEIIKTIDSVYNNFDYDLPEIVDLQPYFVFSLKTTVKMPFNRC